MVRYGSQESRPKARVGIGGRTGPTGTRGVQPRGAARNLAAAYPAGFVESFAEF